MARSRHGRICFFGTYERDYLRNRTLVEGLRSSGWQVQECHVPLWEKERDKTGAYLGLCSLAFRAVELKLAYLRLLLKYVFTVGNYDIMVVGYIGHFDMPLAWLLTRLPRRPLVFSPLISLYDTLVNDRRSFAAGTLMSRLLRRLDRWTCARADLVLLDTDAHIGYFVDTFGLPRHRFARVFVGAPESDALPCAAGEKSPDDREFQVVFIGKFTPLHGLPSMLEAARRLQDEPDIVFHFIGSGQLSDEMHETARRLALDNVRFTEWIPYEMIPRYLQGAGVCLGIFGTTDKAARVIPGKVFIALSLGKAVITADTPAIRELLTDGESAAVCGRGDPDALARAIRGLYEDRELLDRIAEGGRRVFRDHASTEQVGRSASIVLEKLMTGSV
ncbi:MAG: glycosyltransferase [Gemmatimonadetes bacterium]|nr:glycosyltransferase [Gemmatimonadota bacterium]